MSISGTDDLISPAHVTKSYASVARSSWFTINRKGLAKFIKQSVTRRVKKLLPSSVC